MSGGYSTPSQRLRDSRSRPIGGARPWLALAAAAQHLADSSRTTRAVRRRTWVGKVAMRHCRSRWVAVVQGFAVVGFRRRRHPVQPLVDGRKAVSRPIKLAIVAMAAWLVASAVLMPLGFAARRVHRQPLGDILAWAGLLQ